MDSLKFRISRLFLYFLLVSVFLFVTDNFGQYLIETHGMDRKIAMLLQGVIFTGLTLIVLYILKRKSPELFKSIGLKGVNSSSKLAIGIALPFILLVLGIFQLAKQKMNKSNPNHRQMELTTPKNLMKLTIRPLRKLKKGRQIIHPKTKITTHCLDTPLKKLNMRESGCNLEK